LGKLDLHLDLRKDRRTGVGCGDQHVIVSPGYRVGVDLHVERLRAAGLASQSGSRCASRSGVLAVGWTAP
jgi:hypothetical protein